MIAQTTNQFFKLRDTMRISFLMILLSTIWLLSGHTAYAQCLQDSKFTTTVEGKKGNLGVEFNTSAMEVEVQWKDLSSASKKFNVVQLGSVQKGRVYNIFQGEKPSAYLILLSAKDCDPKYTIHTVLVTAQSDE